MTSICFKEHNNEDKDQKNKIIKKLFNKILKIYKDKGEKVNRIFNRYRQMLILRKHRIQ